MLDNVFLFRNKYKTCFRKKSQSQVGFLEIAIRQKKEIIILNYACITSVQKYSTFYPNIIKRDVSSI